MAVAAFLVFQVGKGVVHHQRIFKGVAINPAFQREAIAQMRGALIVITLFIVLRPLPVARLLAAGACVWRVVLFTVLVDIGQGVLVIFARREAQLNNAPFIICRRVDHFPVAACNGVVHPVRQTQEILLQLATADLQITQLITGAKRGVHIVGVIFAPAPSLAITDAPFERFCRFFGGDVDCAAHLVRALQQR